MHRWVLFVVFLCEVGFALHPFVETIVSVKKEESTPTSWKNFGVPRCFTIGIFMKFLFSSYDFYTISASYQLHCIVDCSPGFPSELHTTDTT